MNERIRELAKQASHQSPDGYPVTIPYSKDFVEKFAELLIRECASLCEIESRSYTYSFTPAKAKLAESTAKHCDTIIKRHFGVE